jgi:hypothetical protein
MLDGDFAVAGLDITREGVAALPTGPGVGPNEGVVRIPREIILAAMSEILATETA